MYIGSDAYGDQRTILGVFLDHYLPAVETESLPGPRAYQLDRLSSQLPLGIFFLSLPPCAQFIKLGFFIGEDDLTL